LRAEAGLTTIVTVSTPTSIKTGQSRLTNPEKAVAEVCAQMAQTKPGLVIYFAPANLDQTKVHRAFTQTLGAGAPFMGGSSLHVKIPLMRMFRNIGSDGFFDGISALSLSADAVSSEIGVVADVAVGGPQAATRVLEDLAARMELDLNGAADKYFLLLLCDGPSGHADAVLDALFLRAPGLPIIGGGTADQFNLLTGLVNSGVVHSPQGLYRRGAVMALVRSHVPFVTKMITSYAPTPTQFEVTKASGKIISELNGKPAAEEYARALGVPKWQLGSSRLPNFRLFLRNPVGLVIDGQPYLRGISARSGNDLTVVVGDMAPGQTLRLMRPGDIVADTRRVVSEARSELGTVAGTLLFSCAYRELETDIIDKQSELTSALQLGSSAGLISFGEYFNGLAVEQTLTMVAFGQA
jgi:hypothetical protein